MRRRRTVYVGVHAKGGSVLIRLSPDRQPASRRIGRTLALGALALVLVLLFLPLVETSTAVYTKKSANTFVGDEKYLAVKAEVEAALGGYTEFGEVTLREDVTLRDKSDGTQSSMITFTATSGSHLTGWQLMRSGLPAGTVLTLMLASACLAAALSFLPGKAAGSAAVGFGILALLAVPVSAMLFTRFFTRTIGTVLSGAREADITNELALADGLLYGGKAGDRIRDLLGSFDFSFTAWLWALLVPCFAMICGAVTAQNCLLSHALGRGCLYAFVTALCVLILYPYYVMFITGLRTAAETNDMYFLHMLPVKWMWSNYEDIVRRNVLVYLGNSLMLSIGATLISLLCGIPAAYAMARMKFRGKKAFLGFVIMSQMFSPVVLLVGISRLMINLNLNDSVPGLMLINAAFNQAFAIWLLRGTFVSISPEMEQAACIDGCSVVGALIRVLLPMAAPGIVTTLIFVFINAWNEYTISTVLISTPARKPITVGITQFSSFNMIEWHYLFASALLATIPVVVLFLCIEKHLVAGLTSGGVKG